MESTHSKRKQLQRRNITEVQQKTKLEDMEYSRKIEPSCNFHLRSIEAKLRSKLRDSEARLTQSTSEGRVHLEIKEKSLSIFLDQLQEQTVDNKLSSDKELMQGQICSLKALLEEAQAKHVNSSQTEIEHLKVNLRKICAKLRRAQSELEQQTTTSKDFQVKLEQVKGENEALQDELEAMKLVVRTRQQLRAVAENNIEMTTHCQKVPLADKDTAEFESSSKAELLETDLAFERVQAEKLQKKLSKMEQEFLTQKEDAKKTLERSQASHRAQLEEFTAEMFKISSARKNAEAQLEMERLRLQQEKTSLQKEVDKSRALYMAQLDKKSDENNTLVAALKNVEQQLESHHVEWKEDKSTLLLTTVDLKKTLQEKEQEWQEEKSSLLQATEGLKKTLQEREQEWHEEKSSHVQATEGLKKTLQKREQDWQEDKSSLLQATEDFKKTLQEREQEWQEDKSSLLQATEGLKKTLQEKEQEWQESEGSMRSQLEDLESQLAKKQKKKKWYKKLF